MAYIFINRYFYPDHSATSQMLSDLAFALTAPISQGSRHPTVRVITSRQFYDGAAVQLAPHETVGHVEIYRIWTSRFGHMRLVGRAVDDMTFYLSAAWALWRLAGRGDIIIAKTDPPMLSIIVAPVAWLRRAKLVNWLQDVFPEVAQALGVGTGRVAWVLYGALRWMRNVTLRMASVNVVLGTRMAEKLCSNGIPLRQVRIIPNWADGGVVTPVGHTTNALRTEWGLQDHFVVGYSGNLGRAHDYTTLLNAIRALEQSGPDATSLKIAWLFIGGGALLEPFKKAVQQGGFTSVSFQPYQPRERLAESLSAADLHLVSLRPELEGFIVPSKYYGIAAAGRAALFIGDLDGEVARAITRVGGGINVAEGDSQGLVEAILKLSRDPATCREMGMRARRAFDTEFDKSIAIATWQKLLQAVEDQSGRR